MPRHPGLFASVTGYCPAADLQASEKSKSPDATLIPELHAAKPNKRYGHARTQDRSRDRKCFLGDVYAKNV